MKKTIRLTESELTRIVNSVLNERRVSASELIKDMTLRDVVDVVNSFSNKQISLKEVKEKIEYMFRPSGGRMNEDIMITDEDFPFPDDPNQLSKWHVEEIFKVASSADEANEMIKDHYPGYYFEQTFETPNGKTMNFMSPEGEEIAGRYIIGCCGGSGGAENMDRFKRSDDTFYNPRKRY